MEFEKIIRSHRQRCWLSTKVGDGFHCVYLRKRCWQRSAIAYIQPCRNESEGLMSRGSVC
jgi:hypothetical protein